MLSIINLLKKNEITRTLTKGGGTVRVHKRDIPLSKEWYNSLYVFNKNSIRFLPAVHDYVFKLLKRHFNIVNINLNENINTRKYKKARRSFGNKVWVSTPEIKHLNQKITITVYIYNRLYNKYKQDLNSLEFTWGPNIIETDNEQQSLNTKADEKVLVRKKTELLRHKYSTYLGTNKIIYKESKNFYTKMIKWLKVDRYINIEQNKLDLVELMKKEKLQISKGINIIKSEHYNYLINNYKKELIYLRLKQKILFNRFKFNELYLNPLLSYMQNIYKKKVEFNIVILKNYYLSSSILSQMIVAKVISAKNRGQPLRPINDALAFTHIPNLSGNKLQKIDKLSIGIQNVILNIPGKIDVKHDFLNKFLLTNSKKSKIWSSQYIDNLALKNLENKGVAGIFIKVAGRLTKRYKAQRAVSNLKSRGTLKNVYSAHQGFSSALSRGYSNINVEKTMIHSKVRIGAFGITGWIASY